MSVLAAIGVLALLIVVHEMGHFLAARTQGIYANRFSIGFGPVLLKYQGPETEYAIRAIPFGGFVGFPDDDPEAYGIDPRDPNLLRNRPLLDRAIVISAGVIANLLFAYLLLVVQIGTVGQPEVNPQPGVLIPSVRTELSTAASQAGIQAGDVVLGVNGQDLTTDQAAVEDLIEVIQSSPNETLQFEVQRGDAQLTIPVTPQLSEDGKGRIGVQLAANGEIVRRRPDNPLTVLTTAASEFQRITVLTVQGFWQLITRFRQMADQLASPVRIVDVGAKLAQDDAASLFTFAALISINLAIINILPLPALDGGHLAFLLIEGVRGKPLPTDVQDGVMQTGLMLLLGLGVFLIVRDTTQLESIQKLLGQ